MLRSAPLGQYQFPVLAPQYSSWGEEQVAWQKNVLFFDLSFHMLETYIEGPDMQRLLSQVTANNISNFGKNRGKQLIACNYDGHIIGDSILFGLDDNKCVVVGTPWAGDWVIYQAETGGYDVQITRDDPIGFNKSGRRLGFRYQLQGPNALKLVEKASGGTMPAIKFFSIGEFTIADRPVRALNHTMTKLPGVDSTGLEIYGPVEYRDEVKAALFAAGAEFELKEGGALAYASTPIANGWWPLPLPAIYSGEQMRPYREWLTAESAEANTSLGGSFTSANVDDYYVTPWDIGYGRVINLDHDFIGSDALRAAADKPHRSKVWLRWNEDDVSQLLGRSLFSDPPAKSLTLPTPVYATFPYDAVLLKDETVGVSSWVAYTRYSRSINSLALIDADKVRDGAEVVVMWGEPNGGSGRPGVEPHVQTEIRATVSMEAPQ